MGKPTLAYKVLSIDTIKAFSVYFLKAIIFLLCIPGDKTAMFLARIAGLTAYHLMRETRNFTLESIRIVFPDLTENDVRGIARASFVHQAKNFFELMRYPLLTKSLVNKKVRLEGRENLRRALLREKGVVLLVAHIGNWEMLGAYLGLNGYNVYSFFLDARIDALGRLLNDLRESTGIKLIPREELKKSVKCLKENALLGVIADQDGGPNGVFTKFFGQTVSAPRGPAALSRTSGGTVLPIFMLRNTDDSYTLVVQKPIVLEKTKSKENDIKEYTEKFLDIYERVILENPDQWLWMYGRFKERRHVRAYLNEIAEKASACANG